MEKLNVFITIYLFAEFAFYLIYLLKIAKPKQEQYIEHLEKLRAEIHKFPKDHPTLLRAAKILSACKKSNRRIDLLQIIYLLINFVILLLIFNNKAPEMTIFLITLEIIIIIASWSELNYIVNNFKQQSWLWYHTLVSFLFLKPLANSNYEAYTIYSNYEIITIATNNNLSFWKESILWPTIVTGHIPSWILPSIMLMLLTAWPLGKAVKRH